ncbi:DsbE family thiol:disulfide interchange protein [Defluviimonas sp. WL0024]|uniref:DsbE family thiol:disulfide interchange protein n=2 Tax=Albidovulum TaxID=205889 RepID=A0ABT3J3B2_9RHOB|nr:MULTISPECIES: DsbE family thiol:disulfide interchange protein [Defluviimonas]MCU9848759.1 DsbE family thiol:disulfide interchange protein [Defluviimonas sp. WL0024]MCW3782177.1 DsbE family thiol:disulfide interchange protein [Defluviimonas salinarum]
MARISPLMALPPAIFAGLALMFVLGMQREDPDALPSTLEGRDAPAVVVTPLADLPVFSDADLRDGKVKLVNFWASWCAPCRAEHPNLTKLAGEGVTIYGVNYKDRPQAALKFLADLGNPFAATGADESGRMGIDWGLYGVPETFVIDGEGKVILRFAGPITERVLASDIRPAMEKAAAK